MTRWTERGSDPDHLTDHLTSSAAGLPLDRSGRFVLALFATLTGLAVLALLIGADHTEDAFAWTIRPPLSAAFLGAAYGAGCLLVSLSLRSGRWEVARLPLATICVFAVLTLVASLLHLEAFHFGRTAVLPRAAAWLWMVVYVLVPVLLVAVLVIGERRRAAAPPPPTGPPASGLLRVSLLAHAVVLGAAGIALFLDVGPLVDSWPWPLTPLVARVMGAWLISFAVAALASSALPLGVLVPCSAAYALFAVLELAVLVVHRDDLEPGAGLTVYVVMGVWILLTAVVGTRAALHRSAHHDAPIPSRGQERA